MKISVSNLGRIASATIDLKPLTILVGENNTNKSWLAYSTYALFKMMTGVSHRRTDRANIMSKALTSVLRKLSDEVFSRLRTSSRDAAIHIEYSRESLLSEFKSNVRLGLKGQALAGVLAAPKSAVLHSAVTLTIKPDELRQGSKFFFLQLNRQNNFLIYGEADAPMSKAISPDTSIGNGFLKSNKIRSITFSYFSEFNDDAKLKSMIFDLLSSFALGGLHNAIALPAERKGLSALYQYLPSDVVMQLSLPSRDYIELLRSAEAVGPADGTDYRGPNENRELRDFLNATVGGRAFFQKEGNTKRLQFAVGPKSSLPIKAASSMARSLVGLVMALPRLRSPSVLIVDEPEMNAHPRAQMAIIEILASLANAGTIVLMTTHSPYVIDHLNNLLAAGELGGEDRQEASQKLFSKNASALLSGDSVAAYEINLDGQVTDIFDRDRNRVETSTFGSVSNTMENLYSDYISLNPRG